MRLSYLSIMATGLAYASFVCAGPISVESLDVLSPTSRHTPRKQPANHFAVKPPIKLRPPGNRTTSVIHIEYASIAEITAIFHDPTPPRPCPEKHELHEAAIIRIIKEAATELNIMGTNPEYLVVNPEECACRSRADALFDVPFYFAVYVAGGGRCRLGLHENGELCQGSTRSSPNKPVAGQIQSGDDIIFRTGVPSS